MIINEINNVFSNYLNDIDAYNADSTRPRSKANYSSVKSLTQNIPQEMNKYIDTEKYYCKGSAGEGNFNEVPWVGIFDREITTSARKGYYIVYLFNSEMKGVYLRLALGWTQYADVHSGRNRLKKARQHIKDHSLKAKRLLRSTQGFEKGDIDLSATNDLGKGYESGGVIHKFYKKNNLPSDDQIIVDLHYMIGVYRELKGMLGTDVFTFDQESSFNDRNSHSDTEASSIDIPIPKETDEQANERKKASITGDKAEKIFKDNALERFGWEVIDKTDKQNLGYDFLCEEPELYIEVKGCRGNLDSIRLTKREWEVAEEKKDKYRLVIVYNIDQIDNHSFARYVDPFSCFNNVIKPQVVQVTSLHIKGRHLRELVE